MERNSISAAFRTYTALEVVDVPGFFSRLKQHWKSLLILWFITLGGGGVIGFLIRNRMDFYTSLAKPAFAPPGWLFPVAWSILYTLMALAAWLILHSGSRQTLPVMILYFVQLGVNFFWPVLFFLQEALGLAFVWLMLLWALLLILMACAWSIRRAAFWLLIPYLLWTTFAGVLNFMLALMNP